MVNHGNRIMVNYGIIKYSSGKIAESSSATKLLCHGVVSMTKQFEQSIMSHQLVAISKYFVVSE